MITRFDSKEKFINQLNDKLTLFTGAGFSVMAKDEDDEDLPIGSKLLEELKERFTQISKFPDLSKASTILESTCREEFYEFLIKRFSVANYSNLYNILPLLNIKEIFTTNIDNLIYEIYKNTNDKYINTSTVEGNPYNNKLAVNYSPLHGNIQYPQNGFIFSKTQIASAYTNQHDDWTSLKNIIKNQPILFWGWSFEDSDVIEALYSGKNGINNNENKWILLRNPEDYEIDFYTTLGFKIIEGDTESLLLELIEIQKNSNSTQNEPSGIILPEYSVPPETSSALHPLLSFFEGDSPRWSHIRSGHVPKTHYYTYVSDLLDKNKNIFVIGMPASGKTTLMMQLLIYYQTSKPKHYLISPTLHEVELYIKKLNDINSILFIDDCFRDYTALSTLIEKSNIQLVCFERDYTYETQIFRIRDKNSCFEVVDITEINSRDARMIIDSIPAGAQKGKTTIKVNDRTIYSILAKNMKTKRFEKRFKNLIKDFNNENPIATELFVMICYVHSCGVPVSYEMIYSYLSDITTDYKEVYRYIREVGKIIIKCSDETFAFLNVNFDEQDYYQSRSRYFAEQIINNLPNEPNVLKKVLNTFIRNIPPFRICRFDIFKRYGFDSDFSAKAFNDVEEGKSYYEKCALIDNSEYIFQQAALYFNKKKKYSYAFDWIEKARNFAYFNRFSIDNTHAIIQFYANIEIEDDGSGNIKKLLEESMEELINCYSNDRRKAIHVMSFSNLSIKFYDRYKSDLSVRYLEQAKEWLENEKDNVDCSYKMKKDMGYFYIEIQNRLANER